MYTIKTFYVSTFFTETRIFVVLVIVKIVIFIYLPFSLLIWNWEQKQCPWSNFRKVFSANESILILIYWHVLLCYCIMRVFYNMIVLSGNFEIFIRKNQHPKKFAKFSSQAKKGSICLCERPQIALANVEFEPAQVMGLQSHHFWQRRIFSRYNTAIPWLPDCSNRRQNIS